LTDGRPLVFDTGVYIAAIRVGVLSPAFRLLEENSPRTYWHPSSPQSFLPAA
jgi:hypothetical protein